MARVLLVEDDSQIARALKINLDVSGFETRVAGSVAEGLAALVDTALFDVILLDINLPDGNGIDLCHRLREQGVDRPILFLSARTDEETVVRAMNIGAEDYIRKPFGVEELKVRMLKALKSSPPKRQTQSAGPLTLDVAGRRATLSDKPLALSRREFDILTALVRRPGDVVTRESIIDYLERDADIFDRTIDSHISHLRRKIREVAGDAFQILPVYGVGYKLHWNI